MSGEASSRGWASVQQDDRCHPSALSPPAVRFLPDPSPIPRSRDVDTSQRAKTRFSTAVCSKHEAAGDDEGIGTAAANIEGDDDVLMEIVTTGVHRMREE